MVEDIYATYLKRADGQRVQYDALICISSVRYNVSVLPTEKGAV